MTSDDYKPCIRLNQSKTNLIGQFHMGLPFIDWGAHPSKHQAIGMFYVDVLWLYVL